MSDKVTLREAAQSMSDCLDLILDRLLHSQPSGDYFALKDVINIERNKLKDAIDQQSAPAPEVETVGWGWEYLGGKYIRLEKPDWTQWGKDVPELFPLVRRSDMETALAAKERECEKLRGGVEAAKKLLTESQERIVVEWAGHDWKTCGCIQCRNARFLAALSKGESHE